MTNVNDRIPMTSSFRNIAAALASVFLLLAGGSAVASAQVTRDVHIPARWLDSATHQSGELVAITADSLVFSQNGKEVRRATNAVDSVVVREATADRWRGARFGTLAGVGAGLAWAWIAESRFDGFGCKINDPDSGVPGCPGISSDEVEIRILIAVIPVISSGLIGAGVGALAAQAHWTPLSEWLRHNNITFGVRIGPH